MPPQAIAVRNAGLITSLGYGAESTCAALRASVTNPSPTQFMGADGNWIMAHQVALDEQLTDVGRLVRMTSLAIRDCLDPIGAAIVPGIPLLLCVADRDRPGRLPGLDAEFFDELQTAMGVRFHAEYSSLLSTGRPGGLLAFAEARRLIYECAVPQVLIAAADSLLVWQTLTAFTDRGRLLAEHNSNGFMPGEAAGAILVTRPHGGPGELLCLGVGHGVEPAPLDSGEPLRADGLTTAIKHALEQSECLMHDVDFRIADLSGEHYFFKEAALALSRTLRTPKAEFDIWHPAEGIGEAGAAVGPALVATALTACRNGYAKGPRVLLHASSDSERRVAAVMSWTRDR